MAYIKYENNLISFINFYPYFVLYAFADGSIEGIIKYDGPLPHSRLIHMDADPICYAVNKGNVHSQLIILGDNNTLRQCICIY